MNIEDHGTWVTDTEFEFHRPVELAPGMVMRRVDVSNFFTADPDLTKEGVIEALMSGGTATRTTTEMVAVRCPDCQKEGSIPGRSRSVLRRLGAQMTDGAVLLRCPPCRDRSRN